MFRKLVILVCLISFIPAAAGAQEAAVLLKSQAAVQRAAEREPSAEVTLHASAAAAQGATVVAANDAQPCPPCSQAEGERTRKTHTGLTWDEFVDVHFGGYRWVYWAGAVGAIVLLHVLVVND
jgi:hypothetical protein